MPTNIIVQVTDQVMMVASQPVIASGGRGEDIITFSFDAVWDGFTKTAVFWNVPETVYQIPLDTNDACIIPHEVLLDSGYLYFSVFGVDTDENVRTAEVLKYRIVEGAITENTIPYDPTPELWQQILSKVSDAETGVGALQTNVTAIESKIPSQATSSNQLADKNFVNSSIATNTAYFRGTFNSVSELNAYSGDKTNNDYAFVVAIDGDGNTVYNRYKWDNTAWIFEYALNNSSFTAEQWAAIMSGITSSQVTDIAANTNARHTHNNKSVIDNISSADITAWNGKADKRIVKTTIQNPAVVGTAYYLGTMSSLTVNLPATPSIGDEIIVCFASGNTACNLTVNLTGFSFTPTANKTSYLKFTYSGSSNWLVETMEG